MNANNRSCPGSYLLQKVIGVDVEGFCIHICKDGFCALVKDAVGSCDEGECGRDDFVVGPESQCLQSQVQGDGAVADCNGVPDVQVIRELLFKTFDSLTLGEHAAPQHLSHGFDFFFAYDGLCYGNKISHQDLLSTLILVISILCSSSAFKRFVVSPGHK